MSYQTEYRNNVARVARRNHDKQQRITCFSPFHFVRSRSVSAGGGWQWQKSQMKRHSEQVLKTMEQQHIQLTPILETMYTHDAVSWLTRCRLQKVKRNTQVIQKNKHRVPCEKTDRNSLHEKLGLLEVEGGTVGTTMATLDLTEWKRFRSRESRQISAGNWNDNG